MKLLHVISSMDPKSGGPSQGIRNLNPHLANNKLDIEIVCMDEPNQNYIDIDNEDFKIHKVGTGLTSFKYSK